VLEAVNIFEFAMNIHIGLIGYKKVVFVEL